MSGTIRTKLFQTRVLRLRLDVAPMKSGRSRNSSRLRRDEVRFQIDETLVKSSIIDFMFYVYILLCKDKKTYLGCCDNLKERIVRHEKGNVPATKNRVPVKLISYFAFSNKYTAFDFEKYLKSGSGRAFMKKHFNIDKI